MWVVLVALRRPYTFVVLALLIAIFGVLAALDTRDRHLPEHQHSGRQRRLDLQRSLAKRHVRSSHQLLRALLDRASWGHRVHRVAVAQRLWCGQGRASKLIGFRTTRKKLVVGELLL
jgi:hypothetical protein